MAVAANPVILNGSHGEGGSFLLRTALAMSSLTEQPVRITNVRGATRKPGITSEDLTVIDCLAAATDAECSGAELDSDAITFAPAHLPRAIRSDWDVQVHEKGRIPGNALIVLNALLPVLARAGAYSQVTVRGETYNPNTLTYDCFERVTLEAYRRLGIYAYPTMINAGFGYAARGEVALEIEPSFPNCVHWEERGRLLDAVCVIAWSDVPQDIPERGKLQTERLFEQQNIPVRVECMEVPSRSSGVFVSMLSHFEFGMGSAGAMGARGLRMEVVVNRCFHDFMEWFGTSATVDPYLADQVLLPAALSQGESQFSTNVVTPRLQTVTWVIKQFLPIAITLRGQVGEPGTVTIGKT